jgi:hypothetical protein
MSDEERWEMWRRWLGDDPQGDTIYAQVVEMMAFRQVWDVFSYISTRAPDEVQQDATVVAWFRLGFARSQGLAVRRMADKRSDVISLARLIDDVWRYPTVLSRGRYEATHRVEFGVGLDTFEILFGGGEYIDPRIPARDYEDLQAKTKAVRDWVNSSVAHLTAKKGPKESPPLNAVNDAVNFISSLFRKYMGLIRGVTVASGVMFEPWPYAFRFPWIEDDDAYRDVLAMMEEAERRFLNPGND